ncbi:hypothetical protein [Streptomyces sp. CFMR 7]|uniref:hypothetical protein n=1 Tax=Streptomyces sp. CFMR 7 TaxID=1649184 RepID=UPI0011A83E27|nr:hypothetical protein [Streptomyces sp. CFMR 7]
MSAAAFARPFRLIQRNGVALDDPDWGIGTAARTLDLLLAHSYHGARIEWPDEARPDPDTNLRERIQPAPAPLAARFEALAAEWEKRGEYGDASLLWGARGIRAVLAGEAQPARRRLTPREHDRAWHAVEGSAGEPGADPDTILNAVLHALRIDAPTPAEEQAASPTGRPAGEATR